MRIPLIISYLLFAALAGAADRAGVVAFGDSLSDMGNRWIESGKPDLKFRQTWVAQLAGPGMLDAQGFTPSGILVYHGGSNYAVGGAGTEFTAKMGSERNRGQNLSEQITGRYLNPRFNTDGVKKEALHVIVIGANDLMLASAGLDQIVTQWSNLDKTAIEVARSTASQIQALASAGVTRVMWGNVFNVALAPSVVAKAKTLGGFIASPYLAALTKSVEAHNREMDEATHVLGKSHPSLKIIKLDLHARFAEVAADPAKFGFENVTTGANDSRHLFSVDGLHPTPQGHKMLAEYAFSVLAAADPAVQAALTPAVRPSNER